MGNEKSETPGAAENVRWHVDLRARLGVVPTFRVHDVARKRAQDPIAVHYARTYQSGGDRDPVDMTPEQRRDWGTRRGFTRKALTQFVRVGSFEELDLSDDELADSDRAMEGPGDDTSINLLRKRQPKPEPGTDGTP